MFQSISIRNLSNLPTRTVLHHLRTRGVQEGAVKSNATMLKKVMPNSNSTDIAVKASSSLSSLSSSSSPILDTSPYTSKRRFQPSLSQHCAQSSEEEDYINNDSNNNKYKLLSTKAKVRRTFSPNSNASAMLVCGGKELAAYASFDPEYKRAKGYIQNHAVGPAVLSPILISGLVGALVESTLPQSVFISGNMKQSRPLIVGVEVEASIQVISVKNCNEETMITTSNGEHSYVGGAFFDRYHGFELVLDTQVKRVSDGAIISSGNQTVWLPDY